MMNNTSDDATWSTPLMHSDLQASINVSITSDGIFTSPV